MNIAAQISVTLLTIHCIVNAVWQIQMVISTMKRLLTMDVNANGIQAP